MNVFPKEKHLELIQAVISRMAGNSFLLKGWSVTLAAALLALGYLGLALPDAVAPVKPFGSVP
jgi:hypothetical protein